MPSSRLETASIAVHIDTGSVANLRFQNPTEPLHTEIEEGRLEKMPLTKFELEEKYTYQTGFLANLEYIFTTGFGITSINAPRLTD